MATQPKTYLSSGCDPELGKDTISRKVTCCQGHSEDAMFCLISSLITENNALKLQVRRLTMVDKQYPTSASLDSCRRSFGAENSHECQGRGVDCRCLDGIKFQCDLKPDKADNARKCWKGNVDSPMLATSRRQGKQTLDSKCNAVKHFESREENKLQCDLKPDKAVPAGNEDLEKIDAKDSRRNTYAEIAGRIKEEVSLTHECCSEDYDGKSNLKINCISLKSEVRNKRKPMYWKSCRYCGKVHKFGSEFCLAYGKKCHKCGKNNHIARVCRSARKIEVSNAIINLTFQYWINNITGKCLKKRRMTLETEQRIKAYKVSYDPYFNPEGVLEVLREFTESEKLPKQIQLVYHQKNNEKKSRNLAHKLQRLSRNMHIKVAHFKEAFPRREIPAECNKESNMNGGYKDAEQIELLNLEIGVLNESEMGELRKKYVDFANAILPGSTNQIADLQSGVVWLHLLKRMFHQKYCPSGNARKNYNNCMKILQANEMDARFILDEIEEALEGKEKVILSIANHFRAILNQADEANEWKTCKEIETQFDILQKRRCNNL